MFIKTNYVGIPPDAIPPHDGREGLVWNYLVQLLYNPILALVKASVLLFLGRLFGQKRGARRCIRAVGAANGAHAAAVLAAVAFQCTPARRAWDAAAPGTCVDRRAFFTASAAANVLVDLLILALPLRVLVGLRIPRRTKLALMCLFLLGFLVTITSAIRMVLLVQGLFAPQRSLDPDGNVGFATSAIETNLALVTASAPALRPLLRAWFPRLLGAAAAGADGRDDRVEGATARRVLRFGATSTTRTKLTRARSTSTRQQHQAKTQTRCERANTGDSRNRMIVADNDNNSGNGGGSRKHLVGGFGGGDHGDDDYDGMMEALPFAAAALPLPHNAIIRRSDIHVLYEPNPAVCAETAAWSPSEERKRFEGFV
ncbi:hypothetical protein SLS62_004534 [Diatrype stigma]|uniref:Rhodopsin domain-containing protein n=1 Tax=Diatrype stigma TaxID=117547 RepID=A0AAN9UQK3_9PEZI